MKQIELRLIAELMKDGRASDRELARKLGVSLPTVFRMRKKLKKEGYIKEYTVIPDFEKLGFQIMSLTLAKLIQHHSEGKIAVAREKLREMLKSEDVTTLLCMRGFGADTDFVTMAFHENYAAYRRFVAIIKQQPLLDVEGTRTFIASLAETHFHPLSLQTLAEYVTRMKLAERSQDAPLSKKDTAVAHRRTSMKNSEASVTG